jgi:hypothetical protein
MTVHNYSDVEVTIEGKPFKFAAMIRDLENIIDLAEELAEDERIEGYLSKPTHVRFAIRMSSDDWPDTICGEARRLARRGYNGARQEHNAARRIWRRAARYAPVMFLHTLAVLLEGDKNEAIEIGTKRRARAERRARAIVAP